MTDFNHTKKSQWFGICQITPHPRCSMVGSHYLLSYSNRTVLWTMCCKWNFCFSRCFSSHWNLFTPEVFFNQIILNDTFCQGRLSSSLQKLCVVSHWWFCNRSRVALLEGASHDSSIVVSELPQGVVTTFWRYLLSFAFCRWPVETWPWSQTPYLYLNDFWNVLLELLPPWKLRIRFGVLLTVSILCEPQNTHRKIRQRKNITKTIAVLDALEACSSSLILLG